MKKKIQQIQEMLQFLPEKDRQLCQKFLDKRMFVELKEIIDSDVAKLFKKLSKSFYTQGEDTSNKYRKLEESYNQLKTLQSIVDEYAQPYLEEDKYVYDYE